MLIRRQVSLRVFRSLPEDAAHALFLKYKDAMVKSFDATSKDPAGSGLLWSNTTDPQVGYGFQDDEVKSGNVLYSSLLYWNATRLMAEMADATGDQELARRMVHTAAQVRRAANKAFWNDKLGVYMASTGLERNNIDVWGNAMAGAMGFTTPDQDSKMFQWFSPMRTRFSLKVNCAKFLPRSVDHEKRTRSKPRAPQ